MLPIAPFAAVNLVAGASHIRFRDFLLGTLAGMSPGILAVTLLTNRVKHVVRNPDVTSIVALALVLLVLGMGAWILSKRLRRTAPQAGKAHEPTTTSFKEAL
jgi:uncharacterized membrane protein YdjX (TVP38/TMEM64 family)